MEKKHGRKVMKIIGMVFAGIVFAVLFAFVFGLAVQYLWNYFMSDIFGLKTITYWQAFALVILAKILFGSFGAHRGRHGHNGRGRWNNWTHPGCSEGREWDFPGENSRHYRDFWKDEGKKAFEEYVKKIKTAETNLED